MKEKEGNKGIIVGRIVRNHIVQDQGEEQEQDPEKAEKKGAGQGGKPRQAVDVGVLVEDGIKQQPTGGNDHYAIPEVGVIEDAPVQDGSFQAFAVQEKTGPGKHRSYEIRNTVKQGVPTAPAGHVL